MRPTRYTLNINRDQVTSSTLTRSNSVESVEFPTINPHFANKEYNYVYMTHRLYSTDNSIMKVKMTSKVA